MKQPISTYVSIDIAACAFTIENYISRVREIIINNKKLAVVFQGFFSYECVS
jgi:hypothetical protein